jgi:hypothetical protein
MGKIALRYEQFDIRARLRNELNSYVEVPLYTDWVTVACLRGCRLVNVTDPYSHILRFLDRSRYFFFQAAPQLYSRGWADPVPEPLLLRKCGSTGNRTWTSGFVARNSDHYTTVVARVTCLLRQNMTVSSNLQCYVHPQAQLLSPLSVNKCTVFLWSSNKGSTAIFCYFDQHCLHHWLSHLFVLSLSSQLSLCFINPDYHLISWPLPPITWDYRVLTVHQHSNRTFCRLSVLCSLHLEVPYDFTVHSNLHMHGRPAAVHISAADLCLLVNQSYDYNKLCSWQWVHFQAHNCSHKIHKKRSGFT